MSTYCVCANSFTRCGSSSIVNKRFAWDDALLRAKVQLLQRNVHIREESLPLLLGDHENGEGEGEQDGGAESVGGIAEERDQDRCEDVLLHSWRDRSCCQQLPVKKEFHSFLRTVVRVVVVNKLP